MTAIGASPPVAHHYSGSIPARDAMQLALDRNNVQQTKDALAAAEARSDTVTIDEHAQIAQAQAGQDATAVQKAQSEEKLAEAKLQTDQISAHAHAGALIRVPGISAPEALVDQALPVAVQNDARLLNVEA